MSSVKIIRIYYISRGIKRKDEKSEVFEEEEGKTCLDEEFMRWRVEIGQCILKK